MKTKDFFKKIKNRWPIILLILVLITANATGWVLGKYVSNKHTNAGVDIVAEGEIELLVTDNGNGSYTIKNTDESSIPAYVRFTVVVTWRSNEDGKLWGTPLKEGVDYRITDSNCTALSYGQYTYYYYRGAGQADELLAQNEEFSFTVEQISTKGDYTMCIEILADGIQCLPADIAQRAWGVTFNDQTRTWSISGGN